MAEASERVSELRIHGTKPESETGGEEKTSNSNEHTENENSENGRAFLDENPGSVWFDFSSVELGWPGFPRSSPESESQEEETGEDLEAINEKIQEGYICHFNCVTFFNRK